MPSGKHKSRTMRRTFRKVPGGQTRIRYVLRKPKRQHCANCKSLLHGTAQKRPRKMKKLSKTKKRPQRIFGGVLCSACTRAKLKQTARGYAR